MFLFSLLSSASFRAFNLASRGILGYNLTTSAVTKSASWGMSFKSFGVFSFFFLRLQPPPRFLLKLTFYKLTTMMVKRKKETKKINHIKFLESYCSFYSCPCNVIPVMHKTNFDWHCIFYRASFFIVYHDNYFIKRCLFHWGYKIWGYIPLRP